MVIFFWICAVGLTYSYFFFPIILYLSARRGRDLIVDCSHELLDVSVIIAAHNEASSISEKLENTLAISYPNEKLKIYVASDASDDGTDDFVRNYCDRGVELIRSDERKGKEHAQWLALSQCSEADVVVFSDVATRLPSDSLQAICSIFACNPEVGAISSEDRFLSEEGRRTGESTYVKYEMALRRLESRVAGLVGLSGSYFAARRDVCEEWDTGIPSDFNIATAAVKKGYRAVSHPSVVGLCPAIRDVSREYARKVRTVNRGMAALAKRPQVLNPLKFGMFAFQMISHKIMRWLVPVFFVSVMFSGIALYNEGLVYAVAAAILTAILAAAFVGWQLPSMQRHAIFRIPYFFVQVNLAIVHAGWLLLRGQRITKWQPSER